MCFVENVHRLGLSMIFKGRSRKQEGLGNEVFLQRVLFVRSINLVNVLWGFAGLQYYSEEELYPVVSSCFEKKIDTTFKNIAVTVVVYFFTNVEIHDAKYGVFTNTIK